MSLRRAAMPEAPTAAPPEGWTPFAIFGEHHYFRQHRSLCGRHDMKGKLRLEPERVAGRRYCRGCAAAQ